MKINTNMEQNIHDLFLAVFQQKYLKVTARSVSVATLLSERYLKKIVYNPYYQRNYVWESDKQSFFIESVILGTEIPPIVLYKSGFCVEVIDGRQRFETLKRFKEDDFALNRKGLMELQALASKKFSKLSPEIQTLLLNTKIRIFEYEIVGLPNLNPAIDDMVKKEIFRRYNSGITPLSLSEVDNAKYDEDTYSIFFKDVLKKDDLNYGKIRRTFFPKDEKTQKSDLISDIVKEFRKILALPLIPISRYADSGKTYLIDLFYDNYIETLKENSEDPQDVATQIYSDAICVSDCLDVESKNAAETLMWGMQILRNEGIAFSILENKEIINRHISDNYSIYQSDNNHYYVNIMTRFASTVSLLKSITGFDFHNYLRDSNFKERLKTVKQSDVDAELTLEKLSGLRIHKPNPSSKPISQILSELETDMYLIRPPYQRQEKIDVRKASSIIESILLGVNLPPLFVYVRKDGIREVIDGQQRLLSIVGFLGRRYKNEEGKIVTSKNHNFKLQDLRILNKYNGKRFSDIIHEVEDAILDFDLDEIEIEESVNEKFEPTDLFIRLNNKPYPIRPNTFEMWNSTVDRDILDRIKEISKQYNQWFYLKTPKYDENGNPRDRMANEELITILSYINYNHSRGEDFTKVLGFYPRLEKFTCRIKTKSNITDTLVSLSEYPLEKRKFMDAVNQTESIIQLIEDVLLNGNPTKEDFNSILNIKNNPTFSRKSQLFYILWLIFYNNITVDNIKRNRTELLSDIQTMYSKLENVEEISVNQQYVDDFIFKLREIQTKYA